MGGLNSNNAGNFFIAESSVNDVEIVDGSKVWQKREPNTLTDNYAGNKKMQRNYLNNRRMKEGAVSTDYDPKISFQEDFLIRRVATELQRYIWSRFLEKFDTDSLNSAAIAISSVSGTDTFNLASGGSNVNVGDIILIRNMTGSLSPNNGVHIVTGVSTNAITCSGSTLVNGSPSTAASFTVIGFRFGSGEVAFTVNTTNAVLSRASGTKDFTDFDLNQGEEIIIGGDATSTYFSTTNRGSARITNTAVTTTAITLDKLAFTGATHAGTSLTLELYFGKFLKHQDEPSNRERVTVDCEFDIGEDDGAGNIATVVTRNLHPDSMKFTLSEADKVNVDYSLIGQTQETTAFDDAPIRDAGTVEEFDVEYPVSNTKHLVKLNLRFVDPTDLTPLDVYAYGSGFSFELKNNLKPRKADGFFGTRDVDYGDLEIIMNHSADVDLDVDLAENLRLINADTKGQMSFAFVDADGKMLNFEIPRLDLTVSKLDISKDNIMKMPVDMNAERDDNFDTNIMVTYFDYVPVYMRG